MSNTLLIQHINISIYINIRTVLFQAGFPCNAFVLELLHCWVLCCLVIAPMAELHALNYLQLCRGEHWPAVASPLSSVVGNQLKTYSAVTKGVILRYAVECCSPWRAGMEGQKAQAVCLRKRAIAFRAPQCIPSKQTKNPLPVRRFLTIKKSPTPETSAMEKNNNYLNAN